MKKFLFSIKRILVKLYWLIILILFLAISYYLFNFYLSTNQKVIRIFNSLEKTAIEKVELQKARNLIDLTEKKTESFDSSFIDNPFLRDQQSPTSTLPFPEVSSTTPTSTP